MKKIILLTLISIWSLNAVSQEYYPLIETDKEWSIACFVFSWGTPPVQCTTYVATHYFWLEGDTVINSKPYLRVYDEGPYGTFLRGFIREDSDKKVWQIDHGEEILLYDFSANVGDTIPTRREYDELIVDSITNVSINQTIRKKYWLSSLHYEGSYYSETWIEGIGSNKGLLSSASMAVVGGYEELLCVHDNGTLIYKNPEYNTCDKITAVENIENANLKIYPNPAKEFVYIENLPSQISMVEVCDITGKTLKTIDLNQTQNIDVKNLKQGIYFVKAGRFVQKFIKQ